MRFSFFGKRRNERLRKSSSEQNVQQAMLVYAEERLVAWLGANLDSSWASHVNSYAIGESRVCAEALPYRIYVYDLDDPMGVLDYDALRRRHDAPGDVFEHKQSNLGSTKIGIFMYRVR